MTRLLPEAAAYKVHKLSYCKKLRLINVMRSKILWLNGQNTFNILLCVLQVAQVTKAMKNTKLWYQVATSICWPEAFVAKYPAHVHDTPLPASDRLGREV